MPSLLSVSTSQMNDEGMVMSGIVLLVSVVLEGIFLLTFLVTHCIGAWIMFRHILASERLRKPSTLPFLAGTIMLLLAFAHFFLNIYIGVSLSFGDLEQRRTPSWYASVSNVKFIIYVTQTLLGDAFMVYRLYVVWARRWPALVFPAILLICDIMLGYSLPWLPMIPTPDFFVMSFFTNVVCTVLIMWRVLQLTFGSDSSPLIWKVIEGIIQSAAVYSAASIALVITVLKSPNVGYVICLNVFPALIGLVFSFIVIRIGLKSRHDDSSPDSTTLQSQLMSTSPSLPTISHERFSWHSTLVIRTSVPGDRPVAYRTAPKSEVIMSGQGNAETPALPSPTAMALTSEMTPDGWRHDSN